MINVLSFLAEIRNNDRKPDFLYKLFTGPSENCGTVGWVYEEQYLEKAECCTIRKVAAVMRKGRTYAGSSKPAWNGVVKRDWKMRTTRSEARMVAGRTGKREMQESTRGSTLLCPIG